MGLLLAAVQLLRRQFLVLQLDSFQGSVPSIASVLALPAVAWPRWMMRSVWAAETGCRRSVALVPLLGELW